MKITAAQYPGFTQNLVTLGYIDLSDTDADLLENLAFLLAEAALNVARARKAQVPSEEAHRRHWIEQENEDRMGHLKMTDGEEHP